MESFGYENKFLKGRSSDGVAHLSFEAAVKACLADERAGGITKEGEKYTVRVGTALVDSPEPRGEVSWLKSELEEGEQKVFASDVNEGEQGFLSNLGSSAYAQASEGYNYYTSAPATGGPMIVHGAVVTPVLRDDNVRHAENVELRAQIKQRRLQNKLDASLTGGDQVCAPLSV